MCRINNLIAHVYGEIEDIVQSMEKVLPSTVGLDDRVGSLRVNEEGIVVSKSMDKNLQYYGGFEYVERECRVELGEYVFYSCEASRVQRCLEHLSEDEE